MAANAASLGHWKYVIGEIVGRKVIGIHQIIGRNIIGILQPIFGEYQITKSQIGHDIYTKLRTTMRSLKLFSIGIKITIISVVIAVGILFLTTPTDTIKYFKNYTGLNKYLLKFKHTASSFGYAELLMSNYERDKFLKRFKFAENMEALKGEVFCPYITYSPDYIYHINTDFSTRYRYCILALEKNGNTLIWFEFYGD